MVKGYTGGWGEEIKTACDVGGGFHVIGDNIGIFQNHTLIPLLSIPNENMKFVLHHRTTVFRYYVSNLWREGGTP